MIEFIGNNAKDIGYWLMFFATVCAYILLHYQKKAYRRLAEMHTASLKDLLSTEMEYNKVICVVTGFVKSHNEWHDRKIKFYYDQDGWHCCYADEMPQGDVFTTEEEITPQNENKDENQG
mgnify:FL=1